MQPPPEPQLHYWAKIQLSHSFNHLQCHHGIFVAEGAYEAGSHQPVFKHLEKLDNFETR